MGNGTGTIDKRIVLIFGVALLFVAGTVAPADAQRAEPGEFEIATINGESADQVNEIEFHDDAPIAIELDGVDVSEHRFNVSIGEYNYTLVPDDEGTLEARRENPSEGQYTLTITLIHRGEERASAETEIEITDAGDRPDRDRDSDERPEPAEFEIATINGESADQVNEVEFHDDAPITIELDGVDVSEHRFNVTIGEYNYTLAPDDEGTLEARRENPEEGQYTMNVTLVHRGEPTHSAETEIEITDAGDRPDRDRDREEPPDPDEFEIATINGESADQLNHIEFHDDAPIVIELDGVDVSDHRFNVTIGDYEYRLFPDDEGELEARRENPGEGRYTLTITLVHRGEERASVETEIEITDAGDRPAPDRDREDDRDERPPETEREPDPDEEPPVDGDVDDVPGFGITAALLALSVALALAWSRAGERR